MENEWYECEPALRRPRVLTAVCSFWLLCSVVQLLLYFLAGLIAFRKAEVSCCCPTGFYFSLQLYFFVMVNRILMGLNRTTLVVAIISALSGVIYTVLGMYAIIEEYLRPPIWFSLTELYVFMMLFGIWHILTGVLAAYYNGPYRRWAASLTPRPLEDLEVDESDYDEP